MQSARQLNEPTNKTYPIRCINLRSTLQVPKRLMISYEDRRNRRYVDGLQQLVPGTAKGTTLMSLLYL